MATDSDRANVVLLRPFEGANSATTPTSRAIAIAIASFTPVLLGLVHG